MMLAATGSKEILTSDEYIFEPKLDGYRALCEKKAGALRFTSRNRRDITSEFPELAFSDLIKADCVLDGEIVIYDEHGNPSFSLLQQRKHLHSTPTYVAFDILELGGRDLTPLPLEARKRILAEVVEEGKNLQTMPGTSDGQRLWNVVTARHLEGVMAKKKQGPYVEGRSRGWLKVKNERTVDCVIVGYVTKTRTIASLALGLFDNGRLIYVGQVGTGFSDKLLSELGRALTRARNDVALPNDVQPVVPDTVCEVRYLQYTKDGRLRAPVFVRVRDDKPVEECTIDQVRAVLDEYAQKRDFAKTEEPAPDTLKSEKSIYVVQKHNARRIHFDFRLELNGVLKSWAVPKGLSDDPQDKRLAVRTEDHPIAYADFSGEIPEGEYGAGTVEIWDKGKFVNITIKDGAVLPLDEALEKGHFVIYLKGDRTEGTYAFTRLDDNWLIVKKPEKRDFSGDVNVGGHLIHVTNPQKELDSGIPKAAFVDYYRSIAPLMLPHVADRLISMYRFPEGVQGEKFFQKNMPDYFPDWLESKCITHKGTTTCYAIVKDEAGIVYLANQVIVPHIMVSRADRPDIPDKMIFDLDPSRPDVPSLRAAARKLKDFLEELGFRPYVMTTGGRGFHVAVPVTRELDNDGVRGFALKIAQTLARSEPTLTTQLTKDRRAGRIFIDVNRISAMQTSVAPYAARSEPGLPIAGPFAWDELPIISPTSYTIRNYPKADAWHDFFANAVSVTDVLKTLT